MGACHVAHTFFYLFALYGATTLVIQLHPVIAIIILIPEAFIVLCLGICIVLYCILSFIGRTIIVIRTQQINIIVIWIIASPGLCISACLSACQSLCHLLSVLLSVWISACLCQHGCLKLSDVVSSHFRLACICLSLCMSVSDCLFVSLSLCMSVCVSLCLYLCRSVCLSLYVCLYLPISLSTCAWLPLVCLFACMSVSVSMFVFVCVSVSVYLLVHLCLTASSSVSLHVGLCLYQFVFPCLPVNLSPCLPICLFACLSVLLSVFYLQSFSAACVLDGFVDGPLTTAHNGHHSHQIHKRWAERVPRQAMTMMSQKWLTSYMSHDDLAGKCNVSYVTNCWLRQLNIYVGRLQDWLRWCKVTFTFLKECVICSLERNNGLRHSLLLNYVTRW